MKDIYDVIIIGAGPAGLAAGIYAGRYRLSTLILEKSAYGGQAVLTSEIENYPGAFNEGPVGGQELTDRMRAQAAHFGAEFEIAEIASAELDGAVKKLKTQDGREFSARTVIIAGGAHYRPIGCKNEERFVGCGISYCATCDANFFAGLDVYVAGGGESALEEAMYLARVARRVYIVHRRDKFRASAYTVERASRIDNISFIMDSVVEEADGEDVLDTLRIRNVKTGEISVVTADEEDGMLGLFGFVGMEPETGIYEAAGIELKDGYINAGEDTHTNKDGVYAAGDIRIKSLRQIVTAAADGAVAAFEAERYLSSIG